MVVANYANGFETVLTAPLGPTGLILNVESTNGSPTFQNPGAFVVLAPNNTAKREYIFASGGSTASTITVTDLANRYLEGSASPSSITHDAGTIVRGALTAQLLDQFVSDIEGKAEDNHDHNPAGSDGIEDFYVAKFFGHMVNGEIEDFYVDMHDHGNVTGTVTANDQSVQRMRLTGNTAISMPSSIWSPVSSFPFQRVQPIQIRLVYATASVQPTFPGGMYWAGGFLPPFNTGGADSVDIIEFSSWNGTTIIAIPVALGCKVPV